MDSENKQSYYLLDETLDFYLNSKVIRKGMLYAFSIQKSLNWALLCHIGMFRHAIKIEISLNERKCENSKKKVACLKLSDYNPIDYSQVLHVRSIMLINSISVLLNAKMSLLVFVYITRRVFFCQIIQIQLETLYTKGISKIFIQLVAKPLVFYKSHL